VKAYDVPEAKKYMKYRRETNATAEPTNSTPLADSSAATSSRQTSDARGRSKQSRAPNKKKRGSSQALDGHSSKKRKVGDDEKKPPNEPQKIHPVLQNGLYAAELFAAHTVRQSVFTYVVENDMIYLWYFDRQDAIQCSGINYVQDLPRFMVLLLAIQRMSFTEWGYNRVFEPKPGSSAEVQVPDEDIGEVDLAFDLKSDMRTTHFGLRGRATTVFPVKSKKLSALVPTLPHHNPHNPTNELVAKLYWPEEERESEAEILRKVYEIADKDEEGKVKYHVPEMVWSHKFEDTSTANIRMALGLKDAERGSRVLYIIVFRKLDPITKLKGRKFLSAWWHIVVCHYTLWGTNVHHRDISPSNLMVYKTLDGRYIGVLNDFDLSSTRDSPSGQERTGTVPFMAIELLTKEATEGKVKHLYRHDAESFLWVLTWVSLRYKNGHLLRKGRPLDEWLKVDINTCREKKNDFLNTGRYSIRPSRSHKRSWKVVRSSLDVVGLFYSAKPQVNIPESEDSDDSETGDSDGSETEDSDDSETEDSDDSEVEGSEARNGVSDFLTDATVFETWLQNKIRPRLSAKFLDVRVQSA
jgi:serine/threonine protein kinase